MRKRDDGDENGCCRGKGPCCDAWTRWWSGMDVEQFLFVGVDLFMTVHLFVTAGRDCVRYLTQVAEDFSQGCEFFRAGAARGKMLRCFGRGVMVQERIHLFTG